MHTTNIRYLTSAEVKYTIDGVNIFELRKAQLRELLAKPLGLPVDSAKMHVSKNDMLTQVVLKLDALEAPHELRELKALTQKAPAKKKAEKKKK